jgi:hypothetical protein
MPATSKKLTVREVQYRVKEILTRHSVACGKSSWIDPEGVQGLIDDLREDVIQAIAGGSKVPYALTRCIAELPRVHYGTIPSEPTRTTVVKVMASSIYGELPTESRRDEILLVERYQRCVIELLSMFRSDPLGKCPAHFYIERFEEMVKQKLLRPNLPVSKAEVSPTSDITSEQYYAIREYLIPENDEPSDKYPPGMSPRNLREAFDELVRLHEKRKVATERIVEAANAFLEVCETAENDDEIPY